jgi:hypothetical protein
MVTYTALIALGENGLTISDFTAVNTEYIIDRAIDYVNMRAQINIPALVGVAGVKTVTLTRNQSAVIGLLVTCMLRAAKQTSLANSSSTSGSSSTSKSVGLGALSLSEGGSVSSAISAASSLGSADDFTRSEFQAGLRALMGAGFRRA